MQKLLIFAVLVSLPAFAETLYKCKGDGGVVSYQKRPCGVDQSAAEVTIKQPSPAMMEKIRQEALRQQIADEKWREERRKEEKHKAELRAINARAASEQQWNEYLQQQRVESALREERWAHDDYCRHRQRIDPRDGC